MSQTAERFSHLSLEIPVDGSSDLTALLGSYLDGGEVTKICESCGGRSTLHRLTYRVARLPRILILHLKRFQVSRPIHDGRSVSL